MSSVWLLVHDDRSYDMGDTYVRGAFATREAAEASIVTRTPAGRRSRAFLAHDEWCCSVDEWTVEEVAVIETKEDDPPPTGPGLIRPDFMEQVIEQYAKPMPDLLRRGR